MELDFLEQLGIPTTYRVFKRDKLPDVPFAVWYVTSEIFSGSDFKALSKESEITIELYTAEKNWELEKQLEDGIPAPDFSKREDYLVNDEVLCITYKLTIDIDL